MKHVKVGLCLSALTVTFLTARPAQALELRIENNGSGSDNQVQVTQSTETQVAQSNSASVDNQVSVDQNTGNNQISDNSGTTEIKTGDVSTNTEITNSINNDKVEAGCCQNPVSNTVTVSGNGVDSNNTADVSLNNQTVVNVTQTATIINNITGSAITGNNIVHGNEGNVEISTGNIRGEVKIANGVNTSDVTVKTQASGGLLLKVTGNGEGSENIVTYIEAKNILVQKWEEANIFNNVSFDLNTGNNVVDDNLGSVKINTGDILFNTVIKNDPINDNKVVIDCCDENNPPPVNPPPINPPPVINPPSNGGNGGSGSSNNNNSSSDNGIGGGVVLGEMLPATGTMDMALMIIANILLFLLGYYLRLRSGRAPARV
jgi:hypothetical protein